MNKTIKKIIAPHRLRHLSGDQSLFIPAEKMEGIANNIIKAIVEAVDLEFEAYYPNKNYEEGYCDGVQRAIEIINSFGEPKDKKEG